MRSVRHVLVADRDDINYQEAVSYTCKRLLLEHIVEGIRRRIKWHIQDAVVQD
jgi:hypothetical protein